MYTNTQRRTNSHIGLSVLALFAVAIVAGQARGSRHPSYATDAHLPTAIELGVLIEPVETAVGHEAIRKFRTRPVVIDFDADIPDLADTVSDHSTGHASAL